VHNSIKCRIDHMHTKILRPEKLVKLREAKNKKNVHPYFYKLFYNNNDDDKKMIDMRVPRSLRLDCC